ncbi:MAG TPA: acyl-CoA synthetase FdrA [Hyphomicrobiaceae bacterium]|nr:acyl-CoA synthetase FdrA [Hyphomicrobiaceae bacterium]
MSIVVNEVLAGVYLDSVALMRISRQVAALAGVEEAGLMVGTPANREILAEAGVLAEAGHAATAGDLVIAVRAKDQATADSAIAAAKARLQETRRPAEDGGGAAWQPRTIRSAIAHDPELNIALISVPGDFAIAEARKAIRRGLHAMIFSDNVPLAEEVELKREAQALGTLVMGPDCGTAIISGVPIAFANVVPRGDIGIIGASGTGIQEVSCLIAGLGKGISHAIGTGGRDLKAEVGGITTLMAIDLLDADPATRHIVIISKPPAAEVAAKVLERVARSPKTFTICLLGAGDVALPPNAGLATTLTRAAEFAAGGAVAHSVSSATPRSGAVRGLYSGGTLCAEAQLILTAAGFEVASNVPVPGARLVGAELHGHVVIDLGDDEFTRGRPHPMIEPQVRDAPLAAALVDPNVSVILTDIVLGFGGHGDPAGHLAGMLARSDGAHPAIVASVTGTDGDPQVRARQIARLEAAGVIVAPSNARAAELAARMARGT